MGAPKNRGYKRSWKNLLLDARYQLRFTLVMVGLCAIVMVLLGQWVMRAADKATNVSKDAVVSSRAVSCQDPRELAGTGESDVIVEDEPIEEIEALDDEALDDEALDDEALDEAAAEPARPVVELGESSMEPVVPREALARYHMCRLHHAAVIERLDTGRARILWVMVGTGVLLCLALFVYGIKMTHRVAGPLHKVSLYLAKMRRGVYDEVYDLRRGDHLVDFYAHFKQAHEGMRVVEERDAQVLRELVAEAEQAGVAEASPEAKAALEELRDILAQRDQSEEGN